LNQTKPFFAQESQEGFYLFVEVPGDLSAFGGARFNPKAAE